jgi:hypothetical protein
MGMSRVVAAAVAASLCASTAFAQTQPAAVPAAPITVDPVAEQAARDAAAKAAAEKAEAERLAAEKAAAERAALSKQTFLILTPDVEVSLLTAGGVAEPNKEWTEKAQENLWTALKDQRAGEGGKITAFHVKQLSPEEQEKWPDVERLMRTVSMTLLNHHPKRGIARKLSTRTDVAQWKIGPAATFLADRFNADHAVFLLARDQFSSGGRMAMNVLGMLGCGFGVCIIPGGGAQVGLVSLVNLRTGEMRWFNLEARAFGGDIRDPKGARMLIDTLLKGMAADPSKVDDNAVQTAAK